MDYRLYFSETNFLNSFNQILIDIYNDPCKTTQLEISDINDVMDLNNNEIRLKKDIAIIYYYNEIRLIGLNETTKHFELYNLPNNFKNVLKHIDCFYFNESTISTLLDSEFEEIDYYFSDGEYTFDSNNYIMYYIFP